MLWALKLYLIFIKMDKDLLCSYKYTKDYDLTLKARKKGPN